MLVRADGARSRLRRQQPSAIPRRSAASRCRRHGASARQIPVRSSTRSCRASRPQGNVTLVDLQTYLYYIQLKPAGRRKASGCPTTKRRAADSRRLQAPLGHEFLDNLSIETQDYTFSNGVIGKLVVYNMEERQRVKIVDYSGSKKFEDTKDRREAQGDERRRFASTRSSTRR